MSTSSLSDKDTRRLMRETRSMHRNILRAARADDVHALRSQMNALLDPHKSPLVLLTHGPDQSSIVPMVDAAILSASRGNELTKMELLHNMENVSRSFGFDTQSIAHVVCATELAGGLKHVSGLTRQEMHSDMMAHIDAAGMSNMGLCIPDALS